MRIHIVPWLAANIIRKVRVGTTDSNVKYNEEFSIEGGSVVFTNPGVVKAGRELASLEKALSREVNLEDLIALVINIGVKTSLVPEETVDVEVFSKRFGELVFTMSLLELILIPVSTPMEGRTEFVTATR